MIEKDKSSNFFGNFCMKKKVIVPTLIIFAVIVIGTSYALWQLTFTQSGTNVMTTGCLKLVLIDDSDAINLTDAFPISDEDGKKLAPYDFTIENTCDKETAYTINLENISSGNKLLSDDYIKANLLKEEKEVYSSKLTSHYPNENNVIDSAISGYKLYQGILQGKEKTSFKLRLWMDEETPAIDEVMNASYASKITIIANQDIDISPKDNVMVKMDTQNMSYTGENVTYTRGNIHNIKALVFEDALNPWVTTEEVVDFSEAQDGSVLGYYVKNDKDDNYTLHIQANGKIKANQDASYYGFVYAGFRLEEIRGLENLDTSNVTAMSYMFEGYGGKVLDLSSFDTSNVTTMEEMFERCQYIEQLDLSSFDTSNVTNMDYMFYRCSSLKNVNVNSFNTSKVTTMSYMFGFCSNLTDLNLNGFDTSNVTNMNRMFEACRNLTNLDLSSFNTSKADTNYMFSNCSNLTNVVYGPNFVCGENNTSVSSMFEYCPANKPTDSSWEGKF